MRLPRLVPLLLLSATLLAATCVTDVRQHGDTGPWTGNVVNTGDQPIHNVFALANIYDADDVDQFGLTSTATCPDRLLPGERGAFELAPINEHGPIIESRIPLRAEFLPVARANDGFGPRSGDGLLAQVASFIDQGRVANVRIANNSSREYNAIGVCGSQFTVDGTLASVAFVTALEETVLKPGESITLSLFFADGAGNVLRLYPSGVFDGAPPPCCPREGASTWHSVDTGPFSVLLPPGWVYEPRQGTDSFVGTFAGDGVELTFDYGMFGGDPDDPSGPPQDVHLETISGHTATIAIARGQVGTTGFHIEIPRIPPPPPNALPQTDGLSMFAQDLSDSHKETILQIFRSVRFDHVRVDP